MIVPLYKPLGVSTHSFVKSYGDSVDEKVTHTGSLDPMAEGVVVVLTGEDRFKKEALSDTEKEYEFEVLVGFQTDSCDLLGLVEKVDGLAGLEVEERLSEVVPQFVGDYDQVIPKFSAKRIDGESYFDKAKRGEEWERDLQSVRVIELESIGSSKVKSDRLIKEIRYKIGKVQGDFRQDMILERWGNVIANEMKQSKGEDHRGLTMSRPRDDEFAYEVIKLRAVTSRRFYIRALVRDISLKVGIPLTTYSIVRIRNGKFSVEDCESFGLSYNDI